MKAILEFIDRIHTERNQIFDLMVSEFESKSEEGDWNGTDLKIENQTDVFLYLSEDKKTIETTWGDFDPRKRFSYVIYFCNYHHVAKYTNGGLKFIGFYNSDYQKEDSFEIGNFNVLKCDDGCNFNELRKPTFYFHLAHKSGGNKHNSLRAFAKSKGSCQNALNSIWELDNFYNNWYKRFTLSPNEIPENV